MDELQTLLDEVCRTPVLLVASDFDGTLAPLAADPDAVEVHREALVALKSLAALPQTHTAIISGRAMADLAGRVKDAEGAHLVGSHGSEFETGFAAPLSGEQAELLQKTSDLAREIASRTPGSLVEMKPASVAFHYRNVDERVGGPAVKELLSAVESWPGLQVRHGKMVEEMSVVATHKGAALATLRTRLGATAVVFFGDDVTDEDGFSTLTGPDIGVKVGAGPTSARNRVPDTLVAAQMLAFIAERRAAWIAGSDAIPIERHSLLSDQRCCALVTPLGRISWLCLPRIDSPAIFAELLGGPSAGFFEIRPKEMCGSATQEYVGDTFTLRTKWQNLIVTDYLDCSAGRPHQRAGRTDLLRVIEAASEKSGETAGGGGAGTRAQITFAPRLDFGRVESRIRIAEDEKGLVLDGAVEPCVLYAPGIQWTLTKEGKHDTAVAEIDVGEESVLLELRYGTGSLAASGSSESKRRQQSGRFWESWVSTLQLPEKYKPQVLRSALALRALVYGPTGAIAAAATTSLPETAGGMRNWDYRFCWPRDAAMAAMALARLEAVGPAMRLLDWILGILQERQSALIHPVYTVTGGHLGAEGVIGELSGYRGSRPVRVGNSAANQVQLDVLGPIAELLALLAQKGASLTSEHWQMAEGMVAAVAERWTEADHGIWELRASRRHHVHSKVMCWKTVDCALQVADYLARRPREWKNLRQKIADDILAHAWNPQREAFCSTYEGSDIDAAALSVSLSGLLPANDPRFVATVKAVERELLRGPVVYRYRYDDGLPGIEGGFNLCTAWLIEAYILLGRRSDAEALFDKYLALAGPTGLMAEEYDPHTSQALGNFPQAYSHIGVINCALALCAPMAK